jgi:hypothetical protein
MAFVLNFSTKIKQLVFSCKFFFRCCKISDNFVSGNCIRRRDWPTERLQVQSETEDITHSFGYTNRTDRSHGVHDAVERLFGMEEAVIDAETESHERNSGTEPKNSIPEKPFVLFGRHPLTGCILYFMLRDWRVQVAVGVKVFLIHKIQF